MYFHKPAITGSSDFQIMDGAFKLSAADISLASQSGADLC